MTPLKYLSLMAVMAGVGFILAASFDGTVKQPKLQVTTNITVIGSAGETNRLGGAMTVISNFTAIGTETNLLYQNGSALRYTNGAAQVQLEVINGSGRSISMVANTGVGSLQTPENFLLLGANSKSLQLANAGYVVPNSGGGISLGLGGLPFLDESLTGTLYVEGFYTNPNTDYSRLAISHTGTNGAIVFDSQASGIAGAPRDFSFASNTVIFAQLKTDTRFLRIDNRFGAPYLQAQYDNTTFGADSGTSLTSGTENTAIGWESLKNLTDGSYNVAIGEAMGTSMHANRNTALGWRALRSVEGGENVAVGYNCMTDNSTNSIFIGARVHINNNNLTNVIGIGYNVAVTNDNEIVIGNSTNTAMFTPPVVLRNVTKAEKTAMTAVDGMIVYQTDNTPGLRAYVNGAWVMISTVADP